MRIFGLWVLAQVIQSTSSFIGSTKSSIRTPRSSSKRLSSWQLKAEHDDTWEEIQRQEYVELLNRTDALQQEIQVLDLAASESVGDSELEKARQAVAALECEANQKLSKMIPPPGLTVEEYMGATRLFLNLAPPYRLALIKALGIEDEAISDVGRVPEIVTKIYEERYTLTPKLLVDSLKDAQNNISQPKSTGILSLTKESEAERDIDREAKQIDQNVKIILPRVTRKEERSASAADLKVLVGALDNSIFCASNRPVQIPGGYVVRGKNRKSSGLELIEALDKKLPRDWDCTVSYMRDVSKVTDPETFDPETIMEETDCALVLLNKDFTPIAGEIFYILTSWLSLGTLLLFSIGVYGSNEAVLNQLTDTSALGDFSALDWFNGKVGQVLVPILLILLSHELGHFLVATKDKIKTTSLVPTILPCFGNLPLFGTLTRIKSSPRDLTSLFDFAFLGPVLGFLSSFGFLGAGLVATKAAMEGDASAAEYLPALPVSVLRLSTLGGSIVDNFFAGGGGYITAQDPNTAVPLHPFAIAGYCGILINAVEMLPLGATDGGRLSMTIFGRQGQIVINGLVWLALLVASFTLEDRQATLLITAWATNSIFQSDMEVPCRDESENPSVVRTLAAFGLWFLAILTIIPMGAD